MPKLEFEEVSFKLVGLETKVSTALVQQPKLLAAENCYAERTGEIRHRKGVTHLTNSTVDAGTAGAGAGTFGGLAKYKDSLVAFDDPRLGNQAYQYAETAGAWSEHGTYAPGALLSEDVAAASGGSGIWQTDIAVAGGYTLIATIEDGLDDSGLFNSTVRVTLKDSDGAFICHRLQIYTDGSGASVAEKMNLRVVALLSRIYVFFADVTGGTHDIRCWILDTTSKATITAAIGTSGSGAAAASVVVATDLHTALDLAVFDAAPSINDGIFLCYRTSTANQLKMGFVNTAGVLGSTSTIATVAGTPMYVAVAPMVLTTPHRFGITYCLQTTPNDVYAVIRTWNGAAWATLATSGALDTALGLGEVFNLACRFDDTAAHDTLRIWYSTLSSQVIYQATFTTASVASSRVHRLRRSHLVARPFLAGSLLYFWAIVAYGTKEPLFVLFESETGLPVATFCRAEALLNVLSSVVDDGNGGSTTALLYITRVVDGDIDFASGAVNVGVRAPTWVQNHEQGLKCIEAADSLILAGSLVQQFDGVNFIELGFLQTVDMSAVAFTPGAGGSMDASADYYYVIVPERQNARNKREQGTHTGAIKVTLAAGQRQVSIAIPTIVATRQRRTNTVTASAQTARSDINFAVYRSSKNPASSKVPMRRCGEIANDPTQATVTFVDGKANAIVDANETLYLSDGEVDHTTPPPGHIMCEGQGRVFIAGVAQRPRTIFFSLRRASDEPVNFADVNTIELPDFGGAVTALAVSQETLVAFCERAIYRVRGTGPDNTGQNGTYFDPELVTAEVGCLGQRSVVVAPFGTMFQSERGFQLLDPGVTTVEYIGAPLEGLTGSDNPSSPGVTVTGAVLLPMEQHVRFAGGGGMWVYDYWHKQWFRYLNDGGPSVELGGIHYWVGASAIDYEDESAESTQAMRLVVALLRSTTLQSDLHVRYFGVDGSVRFGTCGFDIKVYVDLETAAPSQTELASGLTGPFSQSWRTDDTTRLVSCLRVEIIDRYGGALAIDEVVFEIAARSRSLSARRGATGASGGSQ
jgi:hypothetical protein